MSDRETKLAQSYEHYYWNSVEFLNRLKSTKVGWYLASICQFGRLDLS